MTAELEPPFRSIQFDFMKPSVTIFLTFRFFFEISLLYFTQTQWNGRTVRNIGIYHKRFRHPSQEGASTVPRESPATTAQAPQCGRLPPSAILLHLAVCREGSRDYLRGGSGEGGSALNDSA
jgi:hypothetical protein